MSELNMLYQLIKPLRGMVCFYKLNNNFRIVSYNSRIFIPIGGWTARYAGCQNKP